jgi:Ca2+/Na+ antiporter
MSIKHHLARFQGVAADLHMPAAILSLMVLAVATSLPIPSWRSL